MNNFTNLGSGSDHRRTEPAIDGGNGKISGDADGILRAGLFYVACDLRELAKSAPPAKADELRALCRLVEAMAAA